VANAEDEIVEMQAESGVYSGGLLDMEDEDETEE
jgi:hypothetical protein